MAELEPSSPPHDRGHDGPEYVVPATQRSYISAVSKFSRYFGKSPERLDLEDVRQLSRSHLVSTGISWPVRVLNQIVCALRFFYGVTLGEAARSRAYPLCARPAQTADRIERGRSRAVFGIGIEPEEPGGANHGLCGGAQGLWKSRGCEWRTSTAARGVILVRHGKGGKDRNRDAVAAVAWHSFGAYWSGWRGSTHDLPVSPVGMTIILLIRRCCIAASPDRRSKPPG